MALRDMISGDIDRVFLNPDEFAETHNLNGDTVKAVVITPTSKGSWISGVQYNVYDGAAAGILYVVHCKKDDLTAVPVYGQRFDLDGTICIVDNVADDLGMLTIELHAEVM